VALLLTPGCGESPTGPDDEPYVRTDRLEYTLIVGGQPGTEGASVDIPFRIENRTAGTWFLETCTIPQVHLQKLEANGEWRTVFDYWNPLSSFCETVDLAPGESFEHTLLLRAGLPGSGAQLPTLDNADPGGVYRLRVERLRFSRDAPHLVPEARRVSNPFELRPEHMTGLGASPPPG
jgi:hypothetical protein